MGRHTSGSAASTSDFVVPATAAIAANDAVVISRNGQCRSALGRIDLDCAIDAPTMARPKTNLPASHGFAFVGTQILPVICALGNGTFATILRDETTALVAKVRLTDGKGEQVGSLITVATEATTLSALSITRLSADQFVVAWILTTSNNLRFTVRNNDGSEAVPPTTVAALSGASNDYYNMLATSDGHVVFVYYLTTPALKFRRYDASGTLQGAETTIVSTFVYPPMTMVAKAGGAWVLAAKTTSHFTYEYNAANGLVATTNVTSLSDQYAGRPYPKHMCVLSSGVAVVAAPVNDLHTMRLSLSSSAAVSVSISVGNSMSVEVPQLIAGQNNTFYVLCRDSGYTRSTLYICKYEASVGITYTPVTLGAVGVGTGDKQYDSGIHAFDIGDGKIGVLRLGYSSTGPAYELRLFIIDAGGGYLEGTEFVLVPSRPAPIYNISAAYSSAAGVMAITFSDNGQPSEMYFQMVGKSIIGVAKDAAAAGAYVALSTTGIHAINQSYATGGAFAPAVSGIPAVKGVVSGSTMCLLGGL